MILYNYMWVDPKGEINSGIITLLFLLLILVLAESFDSFSLGKLISITREAKKNEKEVQKLEKKNADLFSQLISISSNNTQTQSHTNVFGDYLTPPTIRKASSEEVEENKSSESNQSVRDDAPQTPHISYNWRIAGKIALDNYLNEKKIHSSNVITEAKLTTQFHGIDPVSNIQPIYDAYYRDGDDEVFIEFRPNRGMHLMYRDRLYVMLSKIAYYKSTKNVDAYLELVLMDTTDEERASRLGGIGRIFDFFEPAIASGLLRITEIKFTEQELSQIRQQD